MFTSKLTFQRKNKKAPVRDSGQEICISREVLFDIIMKKSKILIPIILGVIAGLLQLLASCNPKIAESYVNHIFPIWVETYGRVTGLFPFSVGEGLLYLAVILLVLFVLLGMISLFLLFFKRGSKIRGFFKKFSFFALWVSGIVTLIMVLNCTMLYQVPVFHERFSFLSTEPAVTYDAKDLAELRDYLVLEANGLSEVMERDEKGYVKSDCDVLVQAKIEMKRLSRKIPNLKGYYPNVKGLTTSDFFSQQYILGYYFPFSMEANYNRNMYITNFPTTVCHELSHLKGFILEDEANFIGYLACIDSEEPLFRYSAILSVLSYVNQDFYDAVGKEEYEKHPAISQKVLADDIFLTKEMWEKVEGGAVISTETVKKASNEFTDTYLQLNDVEDGMISYSRVVELLLRYYEVNEYVIQYH